MRRSHISKIVKFVARGPKRGAAGAYEPPSDTSMSLVTPSGDDPAGLGMFALMDAGDSELHLASVRQFASYMICSMYLAGLDRSYGGLHAEISRIMTATQATSRNTVVDFALVRKMLATPMSSIAAHELSRTDRGVDELGLASEVAYINDLVLSKFLFGKERDLRDGRDGDGDGDDHMFEVRVGATDPDARAHEFAGAKLSTATPSVHAYLTLTLLDPYAYGISERRAVLVFLVSVIQRAILRNTQPELAERELASGHRRHTRELDAEIDASPELAILTPDSLIDGDEGEGARIRAAIMKMPTFTKFIRCLRDHSSDVAHTSNPSFHALYTLLKGTYLVHFASYYLSMAINTTMREEADAPQAPARRAAAHDRDRKCTLSRPILSSLEASARALAKGIDDINGNQGVSGPWRKIELVRLIVKANRFACRVQDRCSYKFDGRKMRLSHLVVNGTLPTIDYGVHEGLDGLLAWCLDDSTPAEDLADLLVRNDDEAQQTEFPLYTRSSEIFEREPSAEAIRDLADATDEAELIRVATFHVVFMMYLVRRSTEDFADPGTEGEEPDAKLRRTRFFRFRTLMLFLSRLYGFFYQSYTSLVQPEKKQPVIVTMLLSSGWKRSVQRENEAERMQKMFSSFTRVMSNMLMFCHHVKGDLYRGPLLLKQLRKLYFSNLALMAVAQQRLLQTVPSCHPFYHGSETQLTLPAAVAAKMIPSDFVHPPEYSLATIMRSKLDDADEDAARLGATNIARSIVGEARVNGTIGSAIGALNVVEYIAATAGKLAHAPDGTRRIDPAAAMRDLMTANALGR
jgi:hypothetical protein